MKKKSQLMSVLCAAAFLILIFDSRTAVRGMQEGIRLCICSLLPALFPFCVLSILITGNLLGKNIRILRPIGRICRIPSGSESIFAVGILGGYPVGAQTVGLAYNDGRLSRHDAERMAIFCSNAGPSFIFGILRAFFPEAGSLWLLWGIQILSALITAVLIPGGKRQNMKLECAPVPSVLDAIRLAAKNMASVCSCVMLFRMLLEFGDKWFLQGAPDPVRVLLSGAFELSNGCILLSSVHNLPLRFATASCMLSFGGLCVWMQSLSVCGCMNKGKYLLWKLVQAAVATVISIIFVADSWITSLMLLILLTVLLSKWIHKAPFRKKEVAF